MNERAFLVLFFFVFFLYSLGVYLFFFFLLGFFTFFKERDLLFLVLWYFISFTCLKCS